MWCIFCCSMYIPALKQIILPRMVLGSEGKVRHDVIISDMVFSGNASLTWHAIEYGLEFLNKGLDSGVTIGYQKTLLALVPVASDGSLPAQPAAAVLRTCKCGGENENSAFRSTHDENFLACHLIKILVFSSVRGAYKLALNFNFFDQGVGGPSSSPDRSAPSWDLMLKPPVAQKISTFAWKLQHQAGMAAAAIPGTMGDDGYKFLMQKPAPPVRRYMNPVDFSESRQGSICFFCTEIWRG
ncbi:hypothetical protein VPH35_000737 [Triticum aestivum]|uniref:Uncharacterized protein n=1 Tax=Triticum turgidum subsp. durum TaxID=4567 RepID=A0A9R0UQ82_TRITD|nr:unnamed protein product [Triticum turgidum subsp. durum]